MIKDRRMYTIIALMLASFLTAVDGTIVDTAMPRIVSSLGGFSMLTWLVTAYMLTSTASVPVYGKLADLIGRKITFTIGAVVFVGGSALCGLAHTMPQLIVFRGIQGLGAGAILPTVQTIIGDLFTPAERAKTQGWFSAVWGFSALVGPLVGGVMVDHASWRFLFYINLPLGILALLMIWRFLDEKVERRKAQVDYLGSVTLTAGVTLLLLVLLTGGTTYPWGSLPILGMAAAAILLLAVFIWQERRAPDPMLPLSLFKMPSIGWPVLASFMVGGVMFGTTIYLPIWAQGVQGFTATKSGLSLLWLSIGWPLAAMVGGRYILKLGIRTAAILGLVLNAVAAVGVVVVARSTMDIPPLGFGLLTFVIGAGMGFSTLAFTLGVQSAVDWSQRGVATAALQFMRTLGGLVWVSVMGATMNLSLLTRLRQIPGIVAASAQEAGKVANSLLDPKSWQTLPLDKLGELRGALATSLRDVHLLVLGAAVISLIVAVMLPSIKLDGKASAKDAASGGH